jgi:transposase
MRNSKFSREFRDSTVQLILNNDESVAKVAADLDVNPKTLYSWVSSYKKEHKLPTRSIKTSSTGETLDEENKRLKKENKLLKQERDILKKATAYFAKETL